jgi:amino-acid N-acetyltransferase
VSAVTIRRARTPDVPAIHDLIELYATDRILLAKERVQLYEDVQDFCGKRRRASSAAVQPSLWEDIARSHRRRRPLRARRGVGRLGERLTRRSQLGIARVFVLTFRRDSSPASISRDRGHAGHGRGPPSRSCRRGVAEFLDLERVPNTLSNHRIELPPTDYQAATTGFLPGKPSR